MSWLPTIGLIVNGIVYCFILNDFYKCKYQEVQRTIGRMIPEVIMVILLTYMGLKEMQILSTFTRILFFFIIGAIVKKQNDRSGDALFIIMFITFRLGIDIAIHLCLAILQINLFDPYIHISIIYGWIVCLEIYSYLKLKKCILHNHIWEQNYPKGFLLIPSLTIFTFLFLHQVATFYIEISYQILCLVVIVTLLICNILVLIILHKQIQEESQRLELSLTTQKNELEIRHLQRIQQKYENHRKFRHDIKNHLQVLQNMRIFEHPDTLAYFETIMKNMKEIELYIECSNKVLEALLNEKLTICEEKKIAITYALTSLDDFSFMSDYDIVTIFSNIIDNAIESSINTKHPRIEFNIARHHDMLVISLNNTTSNTPVIDEDGNILTTKEDRTSHGIGLKTVRKCIDAYGGTLEYKMIDDMFVLSILLPIA